jgi:hypothetical protein
MPTRIPGRNGRILISTTSAGAATPVAFLRSWTIDSTRPQIDTTSMGDTTQTAVAGLPGSNVSVEGFYDADGSNQVYAAATAENGSAKKFYLYADYADTAKYWFGTGAWDVSFAGAVDGAVSFTSNVTMNTALQGVAI